MGEKPAELTGQRFGHLLVTGRAPKRGSYNSTMWWCKCDCGNVVSVNVMNLKRGISTSCGCIRRKRGPRIIQKPKGDMLSSKDLDGYKCENANAAVVLLGAVLIRAKRDVMGIDCTEQEQADAIRFFHSAYFEKLTGMDGRAILKVLLNERRQA